MLSIDTNILLYAQNTDCPEYARTLHHHGVTDLATVNTRDFAGFGFKRVWNPLV